MPRVISRRSWFQVLIASLLPIAICRLTSATPLSFPAANSANTYDSDDVQLPNCDDQITTSIYDAQGRLVQTIDPHGSTFHYYYAPGD